MVQEEESYSDIDESMDRYRGRHGLKEMKRKPEQKDPHIKISTLLKKHNEKTSYREKEEKIEIPIFRHDITTIDPDLSFDDEEDQSITKMRK